MAIPKAKIIKNPIERAGDNIKKSAWSSTMESLATMLLGVLFIAWPDLMIHLVSYIIGAIFIIKGLFDILTYFLDKRNIYSNLLFSGVVATLIGIVALVAGPNIANIFRIIIGVFLIYEALSKLNSAIKLYYAQIGLWRAVATLALIVLILGIFVIFNDAASIIGWVMLIAGAIGIISDIMFIQQVDKVVDTVSTPVRKIDKKSKH